MASGEPLQVGSPVPYEFWSFSPGSLNYFLRAPQNKQIFVLPKSNFGFSLLPRQLQVCSLNLNQS